MLNVNPFGWIFRQSSAFTLSGTMPQHRKNSLKAELWRLWAMPLSEFSVYAVGGDAVSPQNSLKAELWRGCRLSRFWLSALVLPLLVLACLSSAAQAETPKPDYAKNARTMWDMKELSKAPQTHPAEGFQAEGLRAVFFDGPLYHGKPTRVFAWIGIPKSATGKKVPGIVLVHGGGGSAYTNWVKLWNDRGYAAIALDTCGCTPAASYSKHNRHDAGGPPGWGGFDQIDEPRQDQWTYHAVADSILAHSLLRAQPGVDYKRIGVTGISWGGYLTCLIASVDTRFKFAAPVYGCGYYLDTVFAGSIRALGPDRAQRWMEWWDPSYYLGNARMPILWVDGSNDFAYCMDALQESYLLPKGPQTLCVRLRMPHGHGGAGENPKEILAFADGIFHRGDPLPKITRQGRKDSEVWAQFKSSHPIVKAELNITRDSGKWQDRKWEAIPAQVNGNRVTATLPAGVKVYYVNLFDDRDCVVSTEHMVIQ